MFVWLMLGFVGDSVAENVQVLFQHIRGALTGLGECMGLWGESIISNCVAVVLAMWGLDCVGVAAACSVATL